MDEPAERCKLLRAIRLLESAKRAGGSFAFCTRRRERERSACERMGFKRRGRAIKGEVTKIKRDGRVFQREDVYGDAEEIFKFFLFFIISIISKCAPTSLCVNPYKLVILPA